MIVHTGDSTIYYVDWYTLRNISFTNQPSWSPLNNESLLGLKWNKINKISYLNRGKGCFQECHVQVILLHAGISFRTTYIPRGCTQQLESSFPLSYACLFVWMSQLVTVSNKRATFSLAIEGYNSHCESFITTMATIRMSLLTSLIRVKCLNLYIDFKLFRGQHWIFIVLQWCNGWHS